MAQKPIIHMIESVGTIPFDVNAYRAIVYSWASPADVELAKGALRRQVETIEKPDYQSENPVTKAIGSLRLKQTATEPERILIDRIEQIERRQAVLEQQRSPQRLSEHIQAFLNKDITLAIDPSLSSMEHKKLVSHVASVFSNNGVYLESIHDLGGRSLNVTTRDPVPVKTMNKIRNNLLDLGVVVVAD